MNCVTVSDSQSCLFTNPTYNICNIHTDYGIYLRHSQIRFIRDRAKIVKNKNSS